MKITLKLTDDAAATVEIIQRTGETFEAALNRILESLLSTAADFDHFYGEPRDGKGPSGE